MSLTFEKWYPWIYALAAALMVALSGAEFPSADSYRPGLLSAAISASAIFVGFIATAKSIIMAMPFGGIRKAMKKSGYISTLAAYMRDAMAANLLFCGLNIAGFFPAVQSSIDIFVPVWIGLGVFCLTSFWRVGRIMMVLMTLSNSD